MFGSCSRTLAVILVSKAQTGPVPQEDTGPEVWKPGKHRKSQRPPEVRGTESRPMTAMHASSRDRNSTPGRGSETQREGGGEREREGGRETERGGDRERETERDSERETHRQRERQRERDREGERGREGGGREREKEREGGRERDGEITDRHWNDRPIDRKTCEQGGGPWISFPIPFFPPSLISLTVSLDVKHHERRQWKQTDNA